MRESLDRQGEQGRTGVPVEAEALEGLCRMYGREKDNCALSSWIGGTCRTREINEPLVLTMDVSGGGRNAMGMHKTKARTLHS